MRTMITIAGVLALVLAVSAASTHEACKEHLSHEEVSSTQNVLLSRISVDVTCLLSVVV